MSSAGQQRVNERPSRLPWPRDGRQQVAIHQVATSGPLLTLPWPLKLLVQPSSSPCVAVCCCGYVCVCVCGVLVCPDPSINPEEKEKERNPLLNPPKITMTLHPIKPGIKRRLRVASSLVVHPLHQRRPNGCGRPLPPSPPSLPHTHTLELAQLNPMEIDSTGYQHLDPSLIQSTLLCTKHPFGK